VDWGDGWVTPGPTSGGTSTHTYAEAGLYLVTLTDTTNGGQRFLSTVVTA
jgi:PKD repeat protein